MVNSASSCNSLWPPQRDKNEKSKNENKSCYIERERELVDSPEFRLTNIWPTKSIFFFSTLLSCNWVKSVKRHHQRTHVSLPLSFALSLTHSLFFLYCVHFKVWNLFKLDGFVGLHLPTDGTNYAKNIGRDWSKGEANIWWLVFHRTRNGSYHD